MGYNQVPHALAQVPQYGILTEYLRSTPAHHRHPMSPTQVADEQEKGGPHIICDSCYCGNPSRIHGCRFTLDRPCSPSGDFIKAICLGTLGLPLPHGTCSRGHIHKISTPPTFCLRHLLDISAIQTWYRIPTTNATHPSSQPTKVISSFIVPPHRAFRIHTYIYTYTYHIQYRSLHLREGRT